MMSGDAGEGIRRRTVGIDAILEKLPLEDRDKKRLRG
jgi:hypothetical protein